jgi:hypothetical protein
VSYFSILRDEEAEDVGSATKPKAMKLFKRQEDGTYLVSVINPLRFWLTIDYTLVGLSFRQTAAVIAHHCNRSKM